MQTLKTVIASRRKRHETWEDPQGFSTVFVGFYSFYIILCTFFIDIKHFTIKIESKRTPLIKVGVMGEIRTQRSMTHFP